MRKQQKIGVVILLLGATLFTSCKMQSKPVEWQMAFEDNQIKDCNIYTIIIDGEYVFRIALSGRCDSLYTKDYIAQYKNFYLTHDSLCAKRGKVRIEFYGNICSDSLVQILPRLTEELTHSHVVVYDRWDTGIELELK